MDKFQSVPNPKTDFKSPFAAVAPVIVRVPAKHLFDLKALRQVTESVLGQLGCPNCHSGYDIRFMAINEFIVNEKLEVQPFEHGLGLH
jgi:hypothetical protein